MEFRKLPRKVSGEAVRVEMTGAKDARRLRDAQNILSFSVLFFAVMGSMLSTENEARWSNHAKTVPIVCWMVLPS